MEIKDDQPPKKNRAWRANIQHRTFFSNISYICKENVKKKSAMLRCCVRSRGGQFRKYPSTTITKFKNLYWRLSMILFIGAERELSFDHKIRGGRVSFQMQKPLVDSKEISASLDFPCS